MASLAEALAFNAAKLGERTALTDSRRSLPWADLAALALGLRTRSRFRARDHRHPWREYLELGDCVSRCKHRKTIVPIPAFFSDQQCAHIIRDASVVRVIVSDRERPETLPVPFFCPRESRRDKPPGLSRDGGLIIYTSGSTGAPKGVRLQSGQALWSAQTLAREISAGREDRYLSVLPFPLLLELICGIIIPVLVGVRRITKRQSPAMLAPEFRAT